MNYSTSRGVLLGISIGREDTFERIFSPIMMDNILFAIFGIGLTIVLVLMISQYRVWKGHRQRMLAHKDQIGHKPALEIAYDQRSCRHISGDKYWFSVEVFPCWGTIPGVMLSIEKLEGLEEFSHKDRPFRFKHCQGNESVTCSLGEKTHVEVVYFEKAAGAKLSLCFQNQDVTLPSEGPYTMTLKVTGIGAVPDYKSFSIGVHDGTPFMKPISP